MPCLSAYFLNGASIVADFRWQLGERPPPIEAHSKAKLEVLRQYLRAYFDKLNVPLGREQFRLDLVDGFCGGGIFLDGSDEVSGTPLIMLEEARKAEERLNRNRKKPLHFDCHYYFVDKRPEHTEYLKRVLQERSYQANDERITILSDSFTDVADGIIQKIRSRQPIVGRSIFLLDQTGYSHVELSTVSRIFNELHAAEVILTFAADMLVNALRFNPNIKAAHALLPQQKARMLINQIDEICDDPVRGRMAIQRIIRDQVRDGSGAKYDTPFFIRPARSRRALWFLHLSTHPTARNVMIERHWNLFNTFEHYGPGGFGMLGLDALFEPSAPRLFKFSGNDREQMLEQLIGPMEEKLYRLAARDSVTVDVVRREYANETAATYTDINEVMCGLHRDGVIRILDANEKKRSINVKKLKPTDIVTLPPQLSLFDFSRRGKRK